MSRIQWRRLLAILLVFGVLAWLFAFVIGGTTPLGAAGFAIVIVATGIGVAWFHIGGPQRLMQRIRRSGPD